MRRNDSFTVKLIYLFSGFIYLFIYFQDLFIYLFIFRISKKSLPQRSLKILSLTY